jgi:poly(A) polymerase
MPDSPLTIRLREAFADRQIFLVGGCVRDELLGRNAGDLDLTTDARPEEIRRRVGDWADQVWLVGEKFGTIGLEYHGERAEITTFRSDTYNGVSRKPEVAFGDDILGDLSRRDFTINALARNLHAGELLDPFGGREDLAEKLVRFVGDPAARIAEDPLRMLRAVRFCAELGFELDPVAAAGIAAQAEEIRRISWERVRDELDRILVVPDPREAVRLLISLGLAEILLPELLQLPLPEPGRHHIKDVLEHTLDTVAFVPPDKHLRYAALLHDIAKPETFSVNETGVHFYRHEDVGAARAREILGRLRHSAAFVDQVTTLVRDHLRIPFYSPDWSDSGVRRLIYDLGDHLELNMTLADADVRASDPRDYPGFLERMAELRRRIEQVGAAAEIARMKPLLNGEEVMALLGLAPGPRVGEALRYLLDEQLEGRIATREEAEEAVRKEFGAGSAGASPERSRKVPPAEPA